MNIPLTDGEWRAFQDIPEQGYSHRAWVDHKIQERAVWARREALLEAEAAVSHINKGYSRHPDDRPYQKAKDDALAAIRALAEGDSNE